MSDNTLQILLKQLNFSDKEIQIYLTLLQEGELSPQKISKLTNINRSTVYAVCHDLSQIGVIKKNPIKNTSSYLALDPVELQKLYKQDEKDLAIKKAQINSAITELENCQRHQIYNPKNQLCHRRRNQRLFTHQSRRVGQRNGQSRQHLVGLSGCKLRRPLRQVDRLVLATKQSRHCSPTP